MNRRAIDWSFPLLTAGVIIGLFLMIQYPLTAWSDPRVLSTAVLWLTFLLMVVLRYGWHLRGRHVCPADDCRVFAAGLLPYPGPFARRRRDMNLLAVGCSHRTTPVAVRERLGFREDQLARALDALTSRLDCEAVILRPAIAWKFTSAASSIIPRGPPRRSTVMRWPASWRSFMISPSKKSDRTSTFTKNADAVRHLFRVAASLDSLIVGEGQIAGQVKTAYEMGQKCAGPGPMLHALFPHARRVAKRVRTETGIALGHVSVSSAAVDYVRQVFDHFGDKTILVIGAGKMGELTLRHLRRLEPRRIFVANRSPEKAESVRAAAAARPWRGSVSMKC